MKSNVGISKDVIIWIINDAGLDTHPESELFKEAVNI